MAFRIIGEEINLVIRKVIKTNEQWQAELSPEVYYICRLKGTESPGSGAYDDYFQSGIYRCACCQNPVFSSKHKYRPPEETINFCLRWQNTHKN